MGGDPDEAEEGLGDRVVESRADFSLTGHRNFAAGVSPQVVDDFATGSVVLHQDGAAQTAGNGLDLLQQFERQGKAVFPFDGVSLFWNGFIEGGVSGEIFVRRSHLVRIPLPA